jgi:hypothetical protein
MSRKFARFLLGVYVSAMLSGCDSAARDVPALPPSPANLAAIRSRVFATTDREKVLRGAIAALQDLGFVVDRADYALASVSGAKSDYYLLRMTVTVVPRGAAQVLVRAIARYDVTPVLDADPYEKFFAVLSRTLSLEAQPPD